MTDTITLTGLVATTPRHLVTGEGLKITSFRLASTQRRFDKGKQSWIDGETNWYTITAFRQLAVNVVASVSKGQRVVVAGRLRIRDWESGDRAGTTVEIDADALGHDIAWGTSVFTRSVASTVAHDTEVSSPDPSSADPTPDRAAVLEQETLQSVISEPHDELASARAQTPVEVPLPF